jgi:hypothetical protein
LCPNSSSGIIFLKQHKMAWTCIQGVKVKPTYQGYTIIAAEEANLRRSTGYKSVLAFILICGCCVILVTLNGVAYPVSQGALSKGLFKKPPSWSPGQQYGEARANKQAQNALENGLNIGTSLVKKGCECTIMLLPFCESNAQKSDGRCSYVGYERANFLPSLFEKPEAKTTVEPKARRWPAPTALYTFSGAGTDLAESSKHAKDHRGTDTLAPLSRSLHATIVQFDDVVGGEEIDDSKGLATHLHHSLNAGNLCGKLVLVSVEPSFLPILAQELGCGPEVGCPFLYNSDDTFLDDAWQLKFVYGVYKQWVKDQEKEEQAAAAKAVSATQREVQPRGRQLKSSPEWYVFATMQKQGFDPLRWSKEKGKYSIVDAENGEQLLRDL